VSAFGYTQSMVPRNLRKPTARRVSLWWREFLRAWRAVGVASYCDRDTEVVVIRKPMPGIREKLAEVLLDILEQDQRSPR
jgi:hypothetical protein